MNYQSIAQWSQVASSVLFLGVLVWLWIRYIQPAVLAAQAAQNARIAEAERHRDEAKAALDGLQREIGDPLCCWRWSHYAHHDQDKAAQQE